MQFIDIKDSQVKFINQEKDRVQNLENENADLIFQNAMQDFSIQQIQDENAELIFKIAMMEAGL